MLSEENIDNLLKDLVEVSLLWDQLGVIYGRIEASWVPTPIGIVEFVFDLISIGSGDIVVDLGCGDGRVVIEAAKRGAKALCIEIDERLLKIARKNAQQLGVADNILFINNDILNVNISQATVVYTYLTTKVLNKLKIKFFKELKPGTTIISLVYSLGWLEPIEVVEVSPENKYYRIYIYII